MMKPCQNGGKCRSREVTKSPYYSCVCDAKWTGQNCQTKGTYSTLFTRIPNRQLSPCCCFFVSVLYSSFPPKVAPPPPPENWQYSSPPPLGGRRLPYSRFPSSFLQSRLSPQGFFCSDFREKDYGKPIDVKINLLYIPRLLSLHTSVLLIFCHFIIFMDKLLFWFI